MNRNQDENELVSKEDIGFELENENQNENYLISKEDLGSYAQENSASVFYVRYNTIFFFFGKDIFHSMCDTLFGHYCTNQMQSFVA